MWKVVGLLLVGTAWGADAYQGEVLQESGVLAGTVVLAADLLAELGEEERAAFGEGGAVPGAAPLEAGPAEFISSSTLMLRCMGSCMSRCYLCFPTLSFRFNIVAATHLSYLIRSIVSCVTRGCEYWYVGVESLASVLV